MRIVFNSAATTSTDYLMPPAASDKFRVSADRLHGNYDTLSIRRHQTVTDDSCFAEILSKKAVKELAYEASPDHVKAVAMQISAGAYQPDPERIAEKLLGYH